MSKPFDLTTLGLTVGDMLTGEQLVALGLLAPAGPDAPRGHIVITAITPTTITFDDRRGDE